MKRLRAALARHWLAIVSLALVGAGVWTFFAEPRPVGPSVVCRATNPGLHLGPDDGHVFVHPEGRADELVARGALFQPITVPPGRYDVRVVLSRSDDRQSVWRLGVDADHNGSTACDVAFDSGELQIDAAAETGDILAYVYAAGDHDELVTSMSPGEPVFVAAGRYDVRVVLTEASEEKDVEWLHDVEVETGLRTRGSVSFQRGTLMIAAGNGGDALPVGAATFNVHRADDEQRDMVDSGTAGVPLSLPVGRYDVEVTFTASHDKPSRWLTGLTIEDDVVCDRAVEFSSGAATVAVELRDGDAVDEFSAYVYYYRAGDHETPVAYTPAGGHVVLEVGTYDVRVHYLRADDEPHVWLRNIVVESNEVAEATAVFASGQLLVRAYGDDGNELIGDNVFVHVYAVDEHARPIVTGASGELLQLTAGEYDVRAEDTRETGRELWLHRVRVDSSKLTKAKFDLGNEEAAGTAQRDTRP